MKVLWKGLGTHNCPCLCLTPATQFWIAAHEGFYFGGSIVYLCLYDQFHRLFEACTRIAELILPLSPSKHRSSWAEVRKIKDDDIYFICLHKFKARKQSLKKVIHHLRKLEFVLHIPDSAVNFRCFVTLCDLQMKSGRDHFWMWTFVSAARGFISRGMTYTHNLLGSFFGEYSHNQNSALCLATFTELFLRLACS